MIWVLLLLAQAQPQATDEKWWEKYPVVESDPVVRPNPFDQFDPKPERLGPGPHTLVVSDGNAMTRIDYRTGAACQRARDEIRRQVRPPPDTQYVIHGPSRVSAFCVPR